MNNLKLLKTGFVILLLINIFTLTFMWIHHPPRPPFPGHGPGRPGNGMMLAQQLNFNEDQQKQFEKLRNEHHESLEDFRDKGRDLHDQFFELLRTVPTDSVKVAQLADEIAANQKSIELMTFHHFEKVRGLCTPEQQKEFDKIIRDVIRMVMQPKN